MRKIDWSTLSTKERKIVLRRPAMETAESAEELVRGILKDIRQGGESALIRYTHKFDGYFPDPFLIPSAAVTQAGRSLDPELRDAIHQAYENLSRFHAVQGYRGYELSPFPGFECGRMVRPIPSVGLYVPGGTAPLFSTALMLGIPAQLAACPEVLLYTPADRNGEVHPAILYAAELCGIRQIIRLGGVQAIGAMAYGSETLSRVDKIFGPGNRYVSIAKRLVAQEPGGPAIDLPAGPSEVLVIIDRNTPPVFAAADLLAQAEHDADAQVVLIAPSETAIDHVQKEIERQLTDLPRTHIAAASLQKALAILIPSLEEALEIANAYAPEHLILCFEGAERYAGSITNAGSVFFGLYSPESFGDYASGPNHVLPTAAAARAYGGLSVESFQKTITWQTASMEGFSKLAPTVVRMARAEGLEAHAKAVTCRLEKGSKA